MGIRFGSRASKLAAMIPLALTAPGCPGYDDEAAATESPLPASAGGSPASSTDTGAQPTSSSNATEDTGDPEVDPPQDPHGESVFLTVQDITGARISQAVVVHKRIRHRTTNLGQILFEDVEDELFRASVHAPGFASATVAVVVREGTHPGRVVTLMPRGEVTSFDAAEGAVLERNGVRVRIRPNSLRIDGNPATGRIDATVVPYDPAVHGLDALPGPLVALDHDNRLVNLQTEAMVEVTLSQDGRPVQIAPGQTARLEILLPPAALAKVKPGDSIDAWWLDETTSVWMQENSGLVQKSASAPGQLAWVAEVSHFTWWNIDWPWMDSRCIDVKIIDSEGKPRPNIHGSVAYSGMSFEGDSSQSGEFCVELRLGESATLTLGHPQFPIADPILLTADVDEPPSNCQSSLGTAFGKVFLPEYEQPPNLPCEEVVVKIYDNPVCEPGAYKVCDGYPAEHQDKLGVGVCAAGREYCNVYGTGWDPCSSHVVPGVEICESGLGLDDDCDGEVDEENCTGCDWKKPDAKSCYPGPAGQVGKGLCKSGQQLCVEDFMKGEWGACGKDTIQPVTPQVEDCTTLAVDENCDGVAVCDGQAQRAMNFGDLGNPKSYDHYGSGVAVDAASNVYVTGEFLGDTAAYGQGCPVLTSSDKMNPDVVVAKFQAGEATCDWTRRIGGPGQQKADDIAVDSQGNVIVVGTFDGALEPDDYNMIQCPGLIGSGLDDIFVAKYNALGACLWRRSLGDKAMQEAAALAVDGDDDIFITGRFAGTLFAGLGCEVAGDQTDAFVAKLAGTGGDPGSCIWARNFGDHLTQAGTAIAVADDDVWFGGDFQGMLLVGNLALLANDGYDEVFVARLDGLDGDPIDAKMFGGMGALSALAAVPHDGPDNDEFVATGSFSGAINLGGGGLQSNGSTDIFLGRFNHAGAHVWSKSFGGQDVEIPEDVVADAARNIAVVGALHSPTNFDGGLVGGNGGFDAFIAKFDAAGDHVWSRAVGDAKNQFALAAAIDSIGLIHVVGQFLGVMDFGIEVYDPNDGKKTLVNNSDVNELFVAVLEP